MTRNAFRIQYSQGSPCVDDPCRDNREGKYVSQRSRTSYKTIMMLAFGWQVQTRLYPLIILDLFIRSFIFNLLAHPGPVLSTLGSR
jgi:hypothetical protein